MSIAVTAKAPERALTVTRVLNAPREMVFQAWTDPKQLMQWWGPAHHPATQIDMDVRTGGKWRNCVRSVVDGSELCTMGLFVRSSRPHSWSSPSNGRKKASAASRIW